MPELAKITDLGRGAGDVALIDILFDSFFSICSSGKPKVNILVSLHRSWEVVELCEMWH